MTHEALTTDSNQRVLLTGGSGLLGNCILRELVERGYHVKALSRSAEADKSFTDLDVETVRGDLNNESLLTKTIEESDVVIHSAAMIHIGWDRLDASRRVNVVGTRLLADACLRNGKRLIHISTVDTLSAATSKDTQINESGKTASGEEGIPKTPCTYVVSKSEAEAVVRERVQQQSLDAVVLHPGFMLAPYDWKPSSGRMMLEVTKAPLPIAPPGGCSLCDARDVAAAVVTSIDKGRSGQNYILAGENLTYQELWQAMLQAAGSKKRVYRMGQAIKLVGKVIDGLNRVLPFQEGDVNGAAIEMGCLNHFYDSTLAQKELGYSRRPTEETLSDAWQWLESRFRK